MLATLEESVREIEALLEEEYDWLTIQKDIVALKEALSAFMSKNDVAKKITDEGHWTLVKRVKTKWDQDKLKEILGKSRWLKVVKQTFDPDLLDEYVRKGGVKKDEIKKALVTTPEKPHLRFYPKGENGSADDEAEALKEAMGGS